MKYGFMYEHRGFYRICKMAEVLETSRTGYYAWLKRGSQSCRQQRDHEALAHIRAAFVETRETYGPRRLSKHLHQKGHNIGRVRVERLMRENHMVSKTVKKFKATTNSNHDYPVAPNLLNRDFKVAHPNTVWASDITYVATGEGWLYLAAVMDLCTGKVVGWAMGARMTADLVCDALKQAVLRQEPSRAVVCHSDRGVQYACKDYRRLIKNFGFVQSMSRKGNCWDNAPMESFFGTLKTELIYHEDYQTRRQARVSIFEYVEAFYNRVRLQEKLGFLSPESYENLSFSA